MEFNMNKFWFIILYILWIFLYSMNINSARTMFMEGNISPLAQLISLGLTVGIFGVLLWTLLHFRYKNTGREIMRIDNIWVVLGTILMFFSLVVLYRGLKVSDENLSDLNIQ